MIRRLAFRGLGAGSMSPNDSAASFSWFKGPAGRLQMVRRLAFRGLGAGHMSPNDTAASFLLFRRRLNVSK